MPGQKRGREPSISAKCSTCLDYKPPRDSAIGGATRVLCDGIVDGIKCTAWDHVVCVGLTFEEAHEREFYFCAKCAGKGLLKPSDAPEQFEPPTTKKTDLISVLPSNQKIKAASPCIFISPSGTSATTSALLDIRISLEKDHEADSGRATLTPESTPGREFRSSFSKSSSAESESLELEAMAKALKRNQMKQTLDDMEVSGSSDEDESAVQPCGTELQPSKAVLVDKQVPNGMSERKSASPPKASNAKTNRKLVLISSDDEEDLPRVRRPRTGSRKAVFMSDSEAEDGCPIETSAKQNAPTPTPPLPCTSVEPPAATGPADCDMEIDLAEQSTGESVFSVGDIIDGIIEREVAGKSPLKAFHLDDLLRKKSSESCSGSSGVRQSVSPCPVACRASSLSHVGGSDIRRNHRAPRKSAATGSPRRKGDTVNMGPFESPPRFPPLRGRISDGDVLLDLMPESSGSRPTEDGGSASSMRTCFSEEMIRTLEKSEDVLALAQIPDLDQDLLREMLRDAVLQEEVECLVDTFGVAKLET